MVGFKNRYMVMEVFLDPNKDLSADDPIIITQFNLSKAVKDSILSNFGECGLASSTNSFQGAGLLPNRWIFCGSNSAESYWHMIPQIVPLFVVSSDKTQDPSIALNPLMEGFFSIGQKSCSEAISKN
ncbi:uncharacterized protein LOC127253594 [Andrographis paniculata]|uniref:uncharacterized protein LOC127253594 n=1 Tax=Andrographis paniculata TaxID=175694 RepID=UPI0021E73539|nr:uncharacterized protein LOC127253594 [Andrographis paniculata]XP_051134205.1 uncharacterized protein LOC127253594 [Andrographis paniculata]